MFNLLRRLKDPLYKNSIFLMLSSVTGAGTGFVFWVICEVLSCRRGRIKQASVMEIKKRAESVVGIYGEIAVVTNSGELFTDERDGASRGRDWVVGGGCDTCRGNCC